MIGEENLAIKTKSNERYLILNLAVSYDLLVMLPTSLQSHFNFPLFCACILKKAWVTEPDDVTIFAVDIVASVLPLCLSKQNC